VKVGAEPKKVALLILLLVAAAVLFYVNWTSTPTSASPAKSAPPGPAARSLRAAAEGGPLESPEEPKGRSSQPLVQFRPTLKRANSREPLDPTRVDPTLRVDLLAKVRAVEYESATRNLFQFGAAKPKEPPPVNPTGPLPKPAAAPGETPAAEPPKPAKSPPPPINLRYFGYVNRPGDTRRHAFLLDGEEIYVAVEGEIIKRRYKVVRVGINSLVVEDVEFKNEQTLPLQDS
jgi:hypothetical protein